MNIYAALQSASAISMFLSIVIGYGVCYFIVTPILLKKHLNKGIFEAAFWKSIQAENTLHDLELKTNDRAITNTLKTIKYSKYSMIISLVLFILFSVLNIMNQ